MLAAAAAGIDIGIVGIIGKLVATSGLRRRQLLAERRLLLVVVSVMLDWVRVIAVHGCPLMAVRPVGVRLSSFMCFIVTIECLEEFISWRTSLLGDRL